MNRMHDLRPRFDLLSPNFQVLSYLVHIGKNDETIDAFVQDVQSKIDILREATRFEEYQECWGYEPTSNDLDDCDTVKLRNLRFYLEYLKSNLVEMQHKCLIPKNDKEKKIKILKELPEKISWVIKQNMYRLYINLSRLHGGEMESFSELKTDNIILKCEKLTLEIQQKLIDDLEKKINMRELCKLRQNAQLSSMHSTNMNEELKSRVKILEKSLSMYQLRFHVESFIRQYIYQDQIYLDAVSMTEETDPFQLTLALKWFTSSPPFENLDEMDKKLSRRNRSNSLWSTKSIGSTKSLASGSNSALQKLQVKKRTDNKKSNHLWRKFMNHLGLSGHANEYVIEKLKEQVCQIFEILSVPEVDLKISANHFEGDLNTFTVVKALVTFLEDVDKPLVFDDRDSNVILY